MIVTIDKDDRIKIPRELLSVLAASPGTRLDLRVERGQLVANVIGSNPLDAVVGCISLDKPTDEIMVELRNYE